MADFVISSILELVKTTMIDEAKLLLGADDEVKKLEKNLRFIRAVLADAEKKKAKNESLKEWLDSLKEACLDMEDALDEWRIAVELNQDTTLIPRATFWRKVWDFISCFSLPRLASRHVVALNIAEINQRLDAIAKARSDFVLEEGEIIEDSTWRETCSFVEVSDIQGRDVEKGIILGHLLGGESQSSNSEVQTISLVGLGGLGKTAMAQIIYNDQVIQESFNGDVIWVCVSDLFDERKVAKAIIEGLEKISGFAAHGLESDPWEVLLHRISDSIKSRKFFLILDDIWGDKSGKWEELLACLKKGAEGSRILVTTRIVDVAAMMGSSPSQIIHLAKLGDEACWSILKQRALKGRQDDANLEQVGRRIAARCKGLPLAAKTLGSLLQSKRSKREWESVMNSEIWNLDLVEKDIFAPLLLSYRELPLRVRRCFLFCVLYPKDHEIRVHDLIHHWMSQGYLGVDNDADLETEGQNCYKILANRSFFQDFEFRWTVFFDQNAEDAFRGNENPECEPILKCKMHDVVHDFAKYLVESEFVTKVVHPGDSVNISLGKSRHLTIQLEEGSCFPPSISGAEKLRSLLISSSERNEYLDGLPSLLKQFKVLRMLDFNESPLQEGLDNQVLNGAGKLIHLRELKLRYSTIKQLPEALSNLHNLIILDLKRSRVEELPAWIAKLTNLRFLDTSFCFRLSKYPKEIRQLTSLRCLLGAFVRVDCNDDQEFSIADLGNLTHLQTVALEKLKGDTINVEEMTKARLPDLQEFWVRLEYSSKVEFIETLRLHLPSNPVLHLYSSDLWNFY